MSCGIGYFFPSDPTDWDELLGVFFFMTVYKIRDSLTDEYGKIRYDVLKDVSYINPLLTVLVLDGAFAFFL